MSREFPSKGLSDLAARLASWAEHCPWNGYQPLWGDELQSDLVAAAMEIRRLRSVAGAVSVGPELTTIKNALAQATASNCGMQMTSGFYLGDGVFAPNGSGS